MPKITFTMTEHISHDSNAKLQLKPAELALVMYLRLREQDGKSAANRDELLQHLPMKERTLDAALATLKRLGLIERYVVYRPTAKAKAM